MKAKLPKRIIRRFSTFSALALSVVVGLGIPFYDSAEALNTQRIFAPEVKASPEAKPLSGALTPSSGSAAGGEAVTVNFDDAYEISAFANEADLTVLLTSAGDVVSVDESSGAAFFAAADVFEAELPATLSNAAAEDASVAILDEVFYLFFGTEAAFSWNFGEEPALVDDAAALLEELHAAQQVADSVLDESVLDDSALGEAINFELEDGKLFVNEELFAEFKIANVFFGDAAAASFVEESAATVTAVSPTFTAELADAATGVVDVTVIYGLWIAGEEASFEDNTAPNRLLPDAFAFTVAGNGSDAETDDERGENNNGADKNDLENDQGDAGKADSDDQDQNGDQEQSSDSDDPVVDKNLVEDTKGEDDLKLQKPLATPFNITPYAAGDPISCSYGNTGQGQYKDTLCWFDLSYMQGSVKTPINTQWTETYITPDSQMEYGNGCTRTTSGIFVTNYTYSCTATSSMQSSMGAAYGQNSQTRTASGASNTNENTALTNARNAARTAARNANGVYTAGSTFFGPVTNYPIVVQLPGSDYTFEALLDITAGSGQRALRSRAKAFPTYSGAFLGNNNFYTGTTGYPAMYQEDDAGATTTSVTLKNIKMLRNGTAVSGYSVVMADAESTDQNEIITFSHNNAQGMQWLPNNPAAFASANTNQQRKNAAVGPNATSSNACNSAYSGNNLTTYLTQWSSLNAPNPTYCRGAGSNIGSKTGTAMLQALAPTNPTANWSVTQDMLGGGLQGVAFGVLMARTSLTVNVADRVIDSTGNPTVLPFAATVTPEGSVAETATASGSSLTDTVTSSMPVPEGGSQLNYANVPNAFDSSYTQSWQCTKTGGTTTQYWPGPAAGATSPTPPAATDAAWFKLLPNYFIDCTVTYTPPYVTLQKQVDQNGTAAANVAAHWDLKMQGVGSYQTTTSNSSGSGTAPGSTGVKRAIAVNSANSGDVYSLTEAGPNISPWQYGYDWTDLTCQTRPGSSSTTFPSNAVTVTKNSNGQVESANLKVAKGNDLLCTYTNTANKPQLKTKKEAFKTPGQDPADLLDWSETVDPQSTIYYKLTFDNSDGSAGMDMSYTDYLADVLDDATFVANSIRISDGSETGYASVATGVTGITVEDKIDPDKTLLITGTVPSREVRTVWFAVTALDNNVDASARQQGFTRGPGVTNVPNQVGYALNNYLVKTDDPVSSSCAEPATGEDADCTRQLIPAWTVTKDSLPANTARLHKGGNVHYKITADLMNEDTELKALVLTDDLTQVFKTAGWAPNANVPAGALGHGVYLFNKDGRTIGLDGQPNTANASTLLRVQDVTTPTQTDIGGGDMRWILTSGDPIDLPAEAVRAEMWFAVQAGESPAGIPAASAWAGPGNAPATGWKFINYATGSANDATNTSFNPNMCITGTDIPDTSLSPNLADPIDPNFPVECVRQQELSANYFTIRKDAGGAGVANIADDPTWDPDPTGLWNMVGHEFEIRDDVNGGPSSTPSGKLCRTTYNPGIWVPGGTNTPAWDGTWLTPNSIEAGIESTWDWQNEVSETHDAIAAWNSMAQAENRLDLILPVCGTLYEISSGGQKGRWRSENIPAESETEAGNYWLVETKAPNQQTNTNASAWRDVPGVQLLAEPVNFKIWPEDDGGPSFNEGQSFHGRGQLDVVDGTMLDRCNPGNPEPDGTWSNGAFVDGRPTACVNPTGYLMIVKDAVPRALPFTGGQSVLLLTSGGTVLLVITLSAILLWRRSQTATTIKPAGRPTSR